MEIILLLLRFIVFLIFLSVFNENNFFVIIKINLWT